MSESETVIAALGGNALQDPDGDGTYDQQRAAVESTADVLIDLITDGEELIITHGNGPQIGSILRQNIEAADVTPPMPLFANGAQTQGLIGFLIQSALMSREFPAREDTRFVPMVTPVSVAPDDEAFDEPTKPIGPYLSEQDAASLQAENGLQFEQFEEGYRQVVPSPEPQEVYAVDVVEAVVDRGDVPIVAGGGGIPVVESPTGEFDGVDAVIDKDLASALLANQLDADVLLILTDVSHVVLNYGTPDEQELDAMTVEEARTYQDEGHFPRGSMYEKVEAASRFVESGRDRRAIITRRDLAADALAGETGTHVRRAE